MLFVDGENWTIRGRELAAAASVPLTPGPFYIPEAFLWYPGRPARKSSTLFDRWLAKHELEDLAVRSYYFGTVVGDADLVNETRATIHRVGFDPRIFKKEKKTRPTKAVDISLATEMLGHAHLDHFDVGVLLAGDGDYVPLVEAVKRLGKRVWVGFFDQYAARELQLVPDLYFTITDDLLNAWRTAGSKGS
jgi:hypothetical protein